MSFVVSRTPNPQTQPKPRTPPPASRPVNAQPRIAPTLGAYAALPSRPMVAAPRAAPKVTAPIRQEVAPTGAADILRLAAFMLAGAAVVALYVVLPLTGMLHSAIPSVPNGIVPLLLALTLVALGEVAVIRVLVRTTPQRHVVEAPRRRAPAFTGPLGFDVELSAGEEGSREFPSVGRGIPAGPDLLIVRVGSARWRDHQGPIALSAYLPQRVVYAEATILRAEDAPAQGRPQCILHLRLSGMSPEDEQNYRALLA